tara:strand:- start:4126 stop:4374 length:249 start_codon:yes stop_codon:yes gene_type:complete
MNNKFIENKIRFWFKKKNKIIKANTNFLREGIIDSFDIIDLVSFMEKEFDIKFEAEDYQNPDFTVLKNLVKIIKNYRGRLQS